MDHGGHDWWIGGLANLRRAMKIWNQWPPPKTASILVERPQPCMECIPRSHSHCHLCCSDRWTCPWQRMCRPCCLKNGPTWVWVKFMTQETPIFGTCCDQTILSCPTSCLCNVSAMSLQCLCVKKATGNPLRLGAPGIQQMKVAPHRSCTDMQPPFTGLSLLNCSWHHVPVGKVERYWQYWRIIVLQIANESTIL